MTEIPLHGGFISSPVRIGDTVRRPGGDRSEFVHRLLAHFERHDWPGAPRLLGIDDDGREVLTFLDGHVPWEHPRSPEVTSTASLAEVARLVRQFHDLTAGTELAEGQEVVCHNDLSPKNTVYRDAGEGLRPVAFVDWDIAAPGTRVQDLAHVCWQFVDLGPGCDDPVAASGHLRVVCDSYGLDDRSTLLDTVLWWQDRCWRGIASGATSGDRAMQQLRDAGVVESVRAAHDWVAANRAALSSALD